MSMILERILKTKAQELAEAQDLRPLPGLRRLANLAAPPRGFLAALQARQARGQMGLIAEIKKASPSKGLIREDFAPDQLARAYAAGGAACLSVLTDIRYFQGRLSDLSQARAAVDLPCLRKDFLIDPYQVVEARAAGADCILIIMAAVDDVLAAALEQEAIFWGMDVLVEVHSEDEMERALRLRSPLIGINNRDLATFETDLAVSARLAPLAPADRLLVGESGIWETADLTRLAACGIRAVLVGESLMRQADVAAATRALLGTA